ncbi:MAG: hypothetical protein WCK17_02045, partial [Verrucomicrobiota bacterium]
MISIEPKKGIRINLGTYHKLRSYQGGGEFWEHQNQQILQQFIGEFLPRAVENEAGKAGTVLFTHIVDGKDVLCQSTALSASGGGASEKELTRLRDAFALLKAKESDPLIDPNARKLIQAFRLPDPHKDAELYRIVSGSPRKLLVLWGVEKEQNSALDPQVAVAGLIGGASKGRLWRRIIGCLLVLLLVSGLAWQLQQKKPGAKKPGAKKPGDPEGWNLPPVNPEGSTDEPSTQVVSPTGTTPGTAEGSKDKTPTGT